MVVQLFGPGTNLIGLHVLVRLSGLGKLECSVEIGPHGAISASVYPFLERHGRQRSIL